MRKMYNAFGGQIGRSSPKSIFVAIILFLGKNSLNDVVCKYISRKRSTFKFQNVRRSAI